MKDKKIKIGQLLLESLTREQIACMLDVVASAAGLKSFMDDFKKADPDMAATVDNVLKDGQSTADGKTESRLASHKRTLEYWNSLWRHWHEIVAELGDEDGTYAVQDHHWEEPYFAGSFFASDLEQIARDMLGLIDDVYNSVEDPELFTEALEDIEENIASYPDWMGVEYGDPLGLEKYSTLCVLKWLWSGLQHESHPGIALLEKVIEIDDLYELVYLNRNAWVEFFVKLHSMAKGREEIADLLQIWGKVSLKLDNLQRGAAAQLQGVIFRLPANCEAVIKAYKRLISPKIKKSINPLFEQWKTEMAERSFSHYMDAPPVSDSWLHWLIEASLDPKTKKEWFMRKLNGWLRELKKDKKTFKKYWPWLARLTSDLPESKTLAQKYPLFYETALPEEASPDDLLGNFRCSGLKKMKAGPGLAVAMDVWKEHLHLIVPDPTNVYKSDYSHHAAWCKAVHELNQKTYKALLSRWRSKHNRRRNLWRDMKAIGLSV